MLNRLLLLPLPSRAARALFAAERARVEDESVKARALALARAALDGERLSGVTLRSVKQPSAPPMRSRVPRLAILLSASLAVAGLAAASVYRVVSRSSKAASVAAPRVRVARPFEPKQPAPALPVVASLGDEVAGPTVSTTAGGTSNSGARGRSSAAGQYVIELGLLAPARMSSARGDYEAAMRSLAKHQREFPNGQLAEEREALRIRALWGLGRKPAAEAAADAFRTRYPRSGLLSWMKGLPTP
jgi:hypothetical protein